MFKQKKKKSYTFLSFLELFWFKLTRYVCKGKPEHPAGTPQTQAERVSWTTEDLQ